MPPVEPRVGATILVFNGNAGHRGFARPWPRRCASADTVSCSSTTGATVGIPARRPRKGSPRMRGRARAFILARPRGRGHAPGMLGESLVHWRRHAARHGAPAGPALVLRSPFTSMTDVGAFHYPVLPLRWLLSDRFDTVSRIAGLGCPLLVVAGDQDTVIPYAQSRRVFDAAAEPKRFVTIAGGDHNDPALADGPELIEAIDRFLKTILVP